MPLISAATLSEAVAELGPNWRIKFTDADGFPLTMLSFAAIDFGAISYKEVFQNVKTILTTPLFSAALERTLGIDQNIVDLPIDYRRTYEMRGNWRKVRRIVSRYLMLTGNTFSGGKSRQGALKIRPRVRTAANRKGAKIREVAGQC